MSTEHLILDALISEVEKRTRIEDAVDVQSDRLRASVMDLEAVRSQHDVLAQKLVQANNDLANIRTSNAKLVNDQQDMLQALTELAAAARLYLSIVSSHPKGRIEDRLELADALKKQLETATVVFNREIPF